MFRRVFVLIAFLSVSMEAAVLVSNLAEPTRDTSTIDENLWALQSFVTDNNSYSLIDLRTVVGNQIGGAVVVAELRDYVTGTLLTTLAVPSLAGPLSVRTLTPAAAVTLDPNTIYALVLGVNGAGSFGWSYAEGDNYTGPGALYEYGYSSDQGANFGSFNIENPYKIEVNVADAAVPEPSTLILSGAALLLVALLRRG